MYIEPETKIVKGLVKDSFLDQSVEEFTNENCGISYSDLDTIIKKNKSIFVPGFMVKSARESCEKEIKWLFDSFDKNIQQDGIVEKEEVFQIIRDYFQNVNNQQVSDEQIKKLKVLDLIDMIINYYKRNKETFMKEAD